MSNKFLTIKILIASGNPNYFVAFHRANEASGEPHPKSNPITYLYSQRERIVYMITGK